jgi:hypothetical protein
MIDGVNAKAAHEPPLPEDNQLVLIPNIPVQAKAAWVISSFYCLVLDWDKHQGWESSEVHL